MFYEARDFGPELQAKVLIKKASSREKPQFDTIFDACVHCLQIGQIPATIDFGNYKETAKNVSPRVINTIRTKLQKAGFVSSISKGNAKGDAKDNASLTIDYPPELVKENETEISLLFDPSAKRQKLSPCLEVQKEVISPLEVQKEVIPPPDYS